MTAIEQMPEPIALPRTGNRALGKLLSNPSALFGAALVVFFVALAVLAPVLPIQNPTATSWAAVRKAPS
ncbi:MAG: ABC transporter permease, partial [Paracoccaceae bacterium]|nr:ABC transporter permease [Paracoccaceae bacterium]